MIFNKDNFIGFFILAICLLLISFNVSHAQSDRDPGRYRDTVNLNNVSAGQQDFGVILGFTAATWEGNGTDSSQVDSKNGIILGLFASGTGKYTHEFLYSKKGVLLEREFGPYKRKRDLKLTYLEYAFLFNIKPDFRDALPVQPFITLGSSLSYLLNAELDSELSMAEGGAVLSDTTIDVKNKLLNVDVAIVLGFGAEYQLPDRQDKLILNLRYSLGLLDLNDDDDVLGKGSMRNKEFRITAGYSFY